MDYDRIRMIRERLPAVRRAVAACEATSADGSLDR